MGYNNEIELIGHYGSDFTHCQSLWIEKDIEHRSSDGDCILRDMRGCIENGDLTPFDNSTFTFLMKTDTLSYLSLVKERIGKINDIPFKNKEKKLEYYIPYDLHELRLKGDIGEFGKKGDNWYNLLLKFSELGILLKEEFFNQHDRAWIAERRAKDLGSLFMPFSYKVEYTLILTFKEFVKLYQYSQNPQNLVEIREIGREIMESIRDIEDRPFKKSLRVFNLSKEWK